MARLFDDASTEYLKNTAASWALPLSLSAWFSCDVEPGDMVIVSIGEAADTGYLSLRTATDGVPDNALRAQVFDGASAAYSEHITDLAANTWYHGLAVFASNTSRFVYLNGSVAVEETTNLALDSHDGTSIGVSADNTPFGYWSGHIAEVAIWDTAALTVADALVLSKGYSPLFVKPQNLKAYWPLVRGLNDKVGGFNMTATGTVVSAHPRIIYPSGIWVPHKAVVDVTVTPSALAITATLEAPTIDPSLIVTPSAIAITGTVESVTVDPSLTIAPSALTLTSTVESVTVDPSLTISPSVIAITTTLETPIVDPSLTIAPSALVLTGTVESPTVLPSITVTPSVLALTATAQSVTITTTKVVLPSSIDLTVSIQAPTIDTAAVVCIAAIFMMANRR